jgi:hypothetical protein
MCGIVENALQSFRNILFTITLAGQITQFIIVFVVGNDVVGAQGSGGVAAYGRLAGGAKEDHEQTKGSHDEGRRVHPVHGGQGVVAGPVVHGLVVNGHNAFAGEERQGPIDRGRQRTQYGFHLGHGGIQAGIVSFAVRGKRREGRIHVHVGLEDRQLLLTGGLQK